MFILCMLLVPARGGMEGGPLSASLCVTECLHSFGKPRNKASHQEGQADLAPVQGAAVRQAAASLSAQGRRRSFFWKRQFHHIGRRPFANLVILEIRLLQHRYPAVCTRISSRCRHHAGKEALRGTATSGTSTGKGLIDKCNTQNLTVRKAQLVQRQTVLFVCLIVRYTVGSRWIEINKDAASTHKHKHELIIPTPSLNSTIPAQVRREEHKALGKKVLPPLFWSSPLSGLLMNKYVQMFAAFSVSASFSSLKHHAGWTGADRGGKQLFWWIVFSPPLFSADYRHMMTAAQHNAGRKKSLRLYKNTVTRCAQLCRQSNPCVVLSLVMR